MAPIKKPVKGDKTLIYVGIEWQDINHHPSLSECKTAGDAVSDFYKTNSRNLLKIKNDARIMKVPLNGSKQNVNKAEKLVLETYKGYDYYSIASFFTNNHAGKNIAHLKGTQISTACHENGHILGLGHSGAYKTVNGVTEYDDYGDKTSIMSRYSSKYITAPQYYYLGWLPETEYVCITDDDLKTPVKYFLKSLYDFETEKLSTIIYERLSGKPAFISFVRSGGKLSIALHLANGGGSQLIKLIGNEFFDTEFTKLHIKVLRLNGKYACIMVGKIDEQTDLRDKKSFMMLDSQDTHEDNEIMEIDNDDEKDNEKN